MAYLDATLDLTVLKNQPYLNPTQPMKRRLHEACHMAIASNRHSRSHPMWRKIGETWGGGNILLRVSISVPHLPSVPIPITPPTHPPPSTSTYKIFRFPCTLAAWWLFVRADTVSPGCESTPRGICQRTPERLSMSCADWHRRSLAVCNSVITPHLR